jgi:perosamine synthetase
MTTSETWESIPVASPAVDREEKAAVERVLDSGQLASGPEVDDFEAEFASYCGTDHGVATANGTAALHTALVAAGIGEGDTVVTTPFTFIATANAIRFAGAEPVFADIDPETYNLSVPSVRRTVGEVDADAILAVHLYGLPADVGQLRDVADEHALTLVTDAAQAHGARYRGTSVGALGDVGCFSFYPTKNMTTGEGGMVVTDDEVIAERARRFVDHGRDDSYSHVSLGHNFRMTDLAAALGRVQLDRLPGFVEQRRANADRLTRAVADTAVVAPREPEDRRHAYHQYTVRSDRRAALRAHLSERGIDTGVYYPTPVHEQPAYDHVTRSLPAAERAAEEVLSLPVHPDLSGEELDRIAAALASFDG